MRNQQKASVSTGSGSDGRQFEEQPLWTGCHSSFEAVAPIANAYDGDEWVESVRQRALRWQMAADRTVAMPPEPDRPSALPLLLGAMEMDPISVLDVGGGGANAYFHASGCSRSGTLRWTVLERPSVCRAMCVVGMPEQVQFVSSFPDDRFDVVFFGSAIQYFDDWRSVLDAAARASRRFVLLEDVPLVRAPTFAAAQRYFGATIPAWFLNHQELLAAAAESGLRLRTWDRYRAKILGRWDGFPMENYPPEMQVGLSSSLLFSSGH